jgi:hypothetical protein
MPKYRYEGTGPCRVGTLEVNPGDTVDASFSPGKRFVLLDETPAVVGPQSVAQPLEEPTTDEATGRGRRKGGE